MSTNDSESKASQGPAEGRKQDPSTEAQHSPIQRKPLPFDDAGGSEEVVDTTDPQKPPIEIEF
jgi:hypothetical protein